MEFVTIISLSIIYFFKWTSSSSRLCMAVTTSENVAILQTHKFLFSMYFVEVDLYNRIPILEHDGVLWAFSPIGNKTKYIFPTWT